MIKSVILLLLSTITFYILLLLLMCNVSYSEIPLIHYTSNYSVRMGGNTYYQFHDFDPQKNFDVIFLGASKALRSYDPAVFNQAGYNSFNLANPLQHPTNSIAVVKNLLNSTNCKQIFYEITDPIYTNPLIPTIQSDINLITNTRGMDIAFDILLHDPNPKYFNALAIRSLQFNPKIDDPLEGYTGLGFIGEEKTMSDDLKAKLLARSTTRDEIDWNSERLDELKELIEFVKSKGIKITGVYGPVTVQYTNKRIKNMAERMTIIFNSYGCELWDLSRLPSIQDDVHFLDEAHLNKYGARIFTDSLLKRYSQGL